MMSEKNSPERVAGETENAYGSIRISDEAVTTIIGMAASQVKGVAAMSGSMTSGITEKLGKKNLSKGVKLEMVENEAVISLFILVEYGVNIPDLALAIQKEVKKSVENTTALKVREINIFVQGISFEHTEPTEEKSEQEAEGLI